jgi:hypothetical protein
VGNAWTTLNVPVQYGNSALNDLELFFDIKQGPENFEVDLLFGIRDHVVDALILEVD